MLRTIAESISRAMDNTKQDCHQKGIAFVKQERNAKHNPAASDWELQVDLGRQLDAVLLSAALKHVLLLELTVSWEGRMVEENERKQVNYQELVEPCRGGSSGGWKARCKPIEVGCR